MRQSTYVGDIVDGYYDSGGAGRLPYEAIRMIHKARDEYFSHPGKPWSPREQQRRSYYRCLANELIRRITINDKQDPVMTVAQFMELMDDLYERNAGFNREGARYAQIMKEGARDYLDVLR